MLVVLDLWFTAHGVTLHHGSDAGLEASWYGGDREDGVAVLLLHGAGGDAGTSWYALLPALSGGHAVVAPQLGYARLGAEEAEALAEGDAVGLELNLVRSAVRLAGARRVLVVGISVGGWLALRLAAEEPDLVAGVVAVAPAGPNLDGLAERMAASGSEPGPWFGERLFRHPPPLAWLFLRSQYPVMAAWAANLPRYARGVREAGPGAELTLRRVRCPVVLVWGREDRIMPVADAAYYQRMLPRVDTRILDDCGHAVVWDAPGDLERIVLAALAEVDP